METQVIIPGKYRATTQLGCSWWRSSAFAAEDSAIIDGNDTTGGDLTVTIAPTDVGLQRAIAASPRRPEVGTDAQRWIIRRILIMAGAVALVPNSEVPRALFVS